MSQLSGILTALITPFDEDGRIDEQNLRRVVDRSIDGGVDGVVACGSTGEFAALSGAERRHVVETVIDQTAGRVPVVAQTGALSTAEAISLSRHAQNAGASAATHAGWLKAWSIAAVGRSATPSRVPAASVACMTPSSACS